MLPANRRLTTEFFNETIAGRSFHLPSLSIKVIRQREKAEKPAFGKTRFAVAASKKSFKTAVSRNNARRRVYAAIYPLLSFVDAGFFVIVLTKPETLKLKQSELGSDIEKIFTKAGIMKKNRF